MVDLRRCCDTPGRLAVCLLLALGGGVGCPGDSERMESGAACWDGKDNDDDGRIDCDDADCAPLAICYGGSDGGRDAPGPTDGAPDAGPTAGDGPPADLLPPDLGAPDTVPPSTYGRACDFNANPLGRCADGETVCIPGPNKQGGFCSHSCPGPPDSCPAPAAGQRAMCIYGVNGNPFCLFVCKVGTSEYACPSELACVPVQYNQSLCVP